MWVQNNCGPTITEAHNNYYQRILLYLFIRFILLIRCQVFRNRRFDGLMNVRNTVYSFVLPANDSHNSMWSDSQVSLNMVPYAIFLEFFCTCVEQIEMNTEGFNDAQVYDSIVPTGTAPEPEISTIHQHGMEEETRYTAMSTCQPGMPPIQPQQCGMGSPVEHGVMEEPRYTAAPTCQPGMTPLQPGSMVPPPPYSPKLYPPPPYHIALQQQPADFHVPYQPSPVDPGHPGGPDVAKQSFVGPMVMSCIAFWFCGILFGLIAWIVAGNVL